MRKLTISKAAKRRVGDCRICPVHLCGQTRVCHPQCYGWRGQSDKWIKRLDSSISAVSLEKSVVFQLEGEPEVGAYWRHGRTECKNRTPAPMRMRSCLWT